MRVVVVGSGAREHAIAVAISAEHDVVVTPGNDGIACDVGVSPLPPQALSPDLVVVGPEQPLVDGLADSLRAKGIPTLGPGSNGAVLEGSKVALKEIVTEAGVPTADYGVAVSMDGARRLLDRFGPPYVIKTDGLANGKGVLVTESRAEAEEDIEQKLFGQRFGEAGRTVVIEEAMFGAELSVFALVDGERATLLPVARDFKRLSDGDGGPNTGGMGAYSPVPSVDSDLIVVIESTIILPTIAGLRRRGIDYRGILYAGVMLTPEGPKLIEYNVRLGDPEAEVVMPRVRVGLARAFLEAAQGQLIHPPEVDPRPAVSVVLASAGYPDAPESGATVTGLTEARSLPDVQVFSAGLRRSGRSWVTCGGRVCAVTAQGNTLSEARERVYEAVDLIQFSGKQLRRDIASKELVSD
ncbi:MAG: phosphoribosylamine--glycine ligase [Ferrimicrobium sp.]